MNNIVFLLIAVNAIVTYQGLNDNSFFGKYMLRVGSIIHNKEYVRLVSSGFLHGSWTHFIFNMFTLFFFGPEVLKVVGPTYFIIIYLGSLVLGNLISVYFNKKDPLYSAIGASGAVSGILFSAIILIPSMSLYIFPLPIAIPGWLFGIGYVLYSIYGMKNQVGNIGHSAHLGGGIAGILLTIILIPSVLSQSWITIALVLIPFVVLLVNEKNK
ncbi:MAG: rhomboid family intramembrane serine protease [Ichthyobacteriaceae bacterium]|nr:rhomboid family intramembrane serine protease [Ichthyobacteriaceae bacterium]